MRRLKFLLLVALASSIFFEANAQSKANKPKGIPGYVEVDLTVRQPAEHITEAYLVGTFNAWNPCDPNFKLIKVGKGRYAGYLKIGQVGGSQFKVTGCGWNRVQVDSVGKEVPNQIFPKPVGKKLRLTIARFAEDAPPPPRENTLVGSVNKFPVYMKAKDGGIDTLRAVIWKSSGKLKKKVALLCMFDAQNLFDEREAPNGEWRLDETLAKLSNDSLSFMVLGLEHRGVFRIFDYTPFETKAIDLPTGNGQRVSDLLARIAKEAADTLRARKHFVTTIVGGSSLGGLMTAYSLYKYPMLYNGGIVYSPAFWLNKEFLEQIDKVKFLNPLQRVSIVAGEKEHETMVPLITRYSDIIRAKGQNPEIKLVPNGKHNEAFWAAQLEESLRFLLKD